MRATPLTSTGPRNLHRATPTKRPVPHTRWTKRRGPVTIYDPVGRLASVCYQTSCPNSSDPKISWIYDASGNRTSETRANGATTTYSYNERDQLQTATSGSNETDYSYNADGQETAAGSSSYDWNLAGQLTSATVGGTTTTYRYDGAGMRTSATTGSNTINYSWDENAGSLPTLASETDGSGGALRTYLYGNSTSPAAMITPGGSYYYSSDPAGNVADLTDSSGALQLAYSYEPFGLMRSATNVSGTAPANPFQYAGQYTDAGSGLSDLRARNYDPNTGSFLSEDPAGQNTVLASSPYAYTGDSPLVYSDPSGLWFGSSLVNWGASVVGSVGSAVTTAVQALNYAYVQPTVQLAKTDYNCMTGNGGGAGACTAAAVQTGLLLLPGVDMIGAGIDAVAASTSLFRASLRETASNIGSAVTDGAYKLATDQTGEFNPWATLGRGGTEEAGSVSSQAIADTTSPTQSLSQRISEAAPKPPSTAPDETGSANFAAEGELDAVARLPQDIAVNPTAPPALPLNRPIGLSSSQNEFLQSQIAQLQEEGATAFRVNQQQVDINGVRTGINRPDLQYTLNGQRFYEEFETRSLDDAWAHMPRIIANDPSGQFIPWFVP